MSRAISVSGMDKQRAGAPAERSREVYLRVCRINYVLDGPRA